MDRGARMVQRDRNHPCVILWSLGNETGYGANHDALAGWIREADPSRPLHYEPAIDLRGWEDGGETATDIVCPMYPQIDAIRSYGEAGTGRRPLLMCEYSHAMGNSNGSLADYWDVIEATPGLHGGFLWEWKDQALRQHLLDGTVRLAYGGQFGDAPHDGNFVADGLVSADLEPHPAMREVAWVYRPVAVTGDRRGLRIENRRAFTGLADLRAHWELLVDGEVADGGVLAVPEIAGHASATIPLPEAALGPYPDRGAHLTVRWETVHDTWFAPAGHVVSWDQIELACAEQTRPRRPPGGSPADHLVSPTLNLWRAPTDNDGFKLMPRTLGAPRGGRPGPPPMEGGRPPQPAGRRAGRTPACTSSATITAPPTGTRSRCPKRWPTFPGSVSGSSCLPGSAGSAGTGGAPTRTTRTATGARRLASGTVRPTSCPTWCPRSSGCAPAAGGSRSSIPGAVRRSASRCSTPRRCMSRRPITGPRTCSRHRPSPRFRHHDGLVVCLDAAHRGLGTASCGPGVLPEYRIAAGCHEFAYRVSVTPA